MTSRKKLSATEIDAEMSRLPAWSLREGKLHRELSFDSFVDAFGWMARAALIAERMNHHPDWSNVYNRVTVDLHTHDASGVTQLDFALAEAMDALTND